MIDQELDAFSRRHGYTALGALRSDLAGRLAEAEREYDAVGSRERRSDNWMGLATVYMQQGRMQEALKAADRAVELDPKRPTRWLRGRRGSAQRET